MRRLALAALAFALALGIAPARPAAAGTFQAFTSRAAWEAAAAEAGLVVATEDFDAKTPGSVSDPFPVQVGNARFELSYDFGSGGLMEIANGRVETTQSESILGDLTSGEIYGLGMDFGLGHDGNVAGSVESVDIEGSFDYVSRPDSGFVGLLSTRPLDPDALPTAETLEELLVNNFGSDLSYLDDLAVVQAPEPSGGPLAALAVLAALALRRRR